LTQFPAITNTALHVVSFLLNQSNNITWHRREDKDDLEVRAVAALARANESLTRHITLYAGLPLPDPTLCGSSSQEP